MYPAKVKGMDIPVGVSFTVDVLSLHYSEDYWGPTDPNVFDPMRFSPEIKRNPYAYLPFGIGPKNCVVSCKKLISILNFINLLVLFI